MKKVLLLTGLLFLLIASCSACEIYLKIEGKHPKPVFVRGEEILINVRVKHIHRVCRLDIEDTVFEPHGLGILKTSDWKEISPGLWEQNVRVKVTGTQSGKLTFRVSRECSKGYHTAEINLRSS